jgi:hypothetical protein
MDQAKHLFKIEAGRWCRFQFVIRRHVFQSSTGFHAEVGWSFCQYWNGQIFPSLEKSKSKYQHCECIICVLSFSSEINLFCSVNVFVLILIWICFLFGWKQNHETYFFRWREDSGQWPTISIKWTLVIPLIVQRRYSDGNIMGTFCRWYTHHAKSRIRRANPHFTSGDDWWRSNFLKAFSGLDLQFVRRWQLQTSKPVLVQR